MGDDDRSTRSPVDERRRRLLAAAAAATLTGSAGCSVSLQDDSLEVDFGDGGSSADGGADTPSDGDGGDGTDGAESATPNEETPSERAGGTPVVGTTTTVDSLNILTASSAGSFTVLDQLYTWGTTLSPETQRFKPWAFESWQLTPSNIGGSSPTLTATLRDDLTFNDGQPVTAEDVKFTVEYIKRQQPSGSISGATFAAVDSIDVDSPSGTTVNYYFGELDRDWFTTVLGAVILPKHVWSGISDHTQFTPYEDGGDVVGSGPMVLEDFRKDRWFELSMRPSAAIPWNTAQGIDWLHDDGPFIDGLRIELFEDEQTLKQALADGEIDVADMTHSVDEALQVTQQSHLDLVQTETDGYSHHSYNTRRVPMDDPAFRQWLVKLTDKTWLVDDLKNGIGARKGSYAAGYPFLAWRPPDPAQTDGSYEGIPIPDLSFPGEPGTFQLSDDDIAAARAFLVNHPAAKHDYAFATARSSNVNAPDGKELYVNGQPFGDAHTDNDGNGGQGPLELLFNSPQENEDEARFAQRTIGTYNRVGLPIVGEVKSHNQMIPIAYASEDFDIFAMGWFTDVEQTHFKSLFGQWGADLTSSQGTMKFNAMAYTGADSLIQQNFQRMDPQARQPIVKRILAQIYRDAPTNVIWHDRRLQPVNNRFSGWVNRVNGVVDKSTWLTVRRSD